ncbi:hypothetical protein [Bradyrhizobium sp. LM6.9]
MGSANLQVAPNAVCTLSTSEKSWADERNRLAETIAAKRAVLDALKLDGNSSKLLKQIEVRLDGSRVCVKAQGPVLDRAWHLHAVDYKAAFVLSPDEVICTATATADVRDISRA